LAIEGSCPRPILEDLANDQNFKGKLIVDVTEGLFFLPLRTTLKTLTKISNTFTNKLQLNLPVL